MTSQSYIRPSRYEKEIKPHIRVWGKSIGLVRNPTIKDFYQTYCMVMDQQYYPALQVKFVEVATDESTVRDLNSLRGMSETEHYGNLPIRPNSLIYFESPDQKCIGDIICEENWFSLSVIGLCESLGGIALLLADLKGWFRLVTVVAVTDGLRRQYNSSKDKSINITVGAPQDVPLLYGRLKTYLGTDRKAGNWPSLDDRLGTPNPQQENCGKIQPEYDLRDIETFQEFVKHIGAIKL